MRTDYVYNAHQFVLYCFYLCVLCALLYLYFKAIVISHILLLFCSVKMNFACVIKLNCEILTCAYVKHLEFIQWHTKELYNLVTFGNILCLEKYFRSLSCVLVSW